MSTAVQHYLEAERLLERGERATVLSHEGAAYCAAAAQVHATLALVGATLADGHSACPGLFNVAVRE